MTGKQTAIIGLVVLGLSLIVYFTDFNSAEKKRINEEYKAKEEKKKETQLKIKEVEKLQAEQNKNKGFHCLSSWDGSSRALVDHVKKNMREPDSFKHRETTIGQNLDNKHAIIMTYSGKNGFGGVGVQKVYATLSSDCTLIEVIRTINLQ